MSPVAKNNKGKNSRIAAAGQLLTSMIVNGEIGDNLKPTQVWDIVGSKPGFNEMADVTFRRRLSEARKIKKQKSKSVLSCGKSFSRNFALYILIFRFFQQQAALESIGQNKANKTG